MEGHKLWNLQKDGIAAGFCHKKHGCHLTLSSNFDILSVDPLPGLTFSNSSLTMSSLGILVARNLRLHLIWALSLQLLGALV